MSLYKKYYNIFLLGFFSIISQIFIIKEIFSTFSGNELSAGIILALWLTGSGLGNLLAKKLFNVLFDKKNKLFFYNLIFFLLNIILLRYFSTMLGFSFGELINIFYLILYAVFLILPFSLIWGINFNYFFILLKNVDNKESKIYYIESTGAAIGSILAVFIGIKFNSIFFIITILFILYYISLILEKRFGSPVFYITLIIIILLSIFHRNINDLTEKWRFKKLKLISCTETPYGKLSVIKQKKDFSFYNNNVFLFSTGDKITPEVDVSLAISQSEKIDNVLIINNGINGLISNLIGFTQIENITYLEYNKFLLKEYIFRIPAEYLNDKRIRLIINDPRNIIKKIKNKYNIIFLNNPDPYNLQINRYYTYEFFEDIRSILSPDGIIILKLSSSENYINKYQDLYIGSIYNTLKARFKYVAAIPGDICYLLASNKKGVLTHDPEKLNARMQKFNIKSEFFKNYFIKFNMDPFRINSFKNSINTKAKMNHDLNPISYLYGLVLWTTRTSQSIKKFFFFLYNIKFYKILIFIVIILGLNLWLIRSKKSIVLLSMGVIGFTEISLEIISILLYQLIRGSLYINMSLIFFSFMLGLAIGSFLYKHIKLSTEKLFVLIQFLFIFIPVLLILHYFMVRSIQIPVIQDIFFFIFILSFSILSGLQFPAAIHLYPDKIFGPGRINGVDLSCAAVGAFIISLFIIPLFGLYNAVILLVILNLLTFIKAVGLLRGRSLP